MANISGSPSTDPLPFLAAASLSGLVVIVAAILLCHGFQKNRPWVSAISIAVPALFAVSSSVIFGIVLSRSERLRGVYIIPLLLNITLLGVYELLHCWQILRSLFPCLQKFCVGVGFSSLLLGIALCIWLGVKREHQSLILVVFLSITCFVYFVASFVYFRADVYRRRHDLYLLGNGICLALVAVLNVVLIILHLSIRNPDWNSTFAWISLITCCTPVPWKPLYAYLRGTHSDDRLTWQCVGEQRLEQGPSTTSRDISSIYFDSTSAAQGLTNPPLAANHDEGIHTFISSPAVCEKR